jgi:hypothetical protein
MWKLFMISVAEQETNVDVFAGQVEEYQRQWYEPFCSNCVSVAWWEENAYVCPVCKKSFPARLRTKTDEDFKLIVAGSRTIGQGFYSINETERSYAVDMISDIMSRITAFLDQEDINWWDVEIVSGRAKGPDTFGEWWALSHGSAIKFFPADWKLGPKAGFIRNEQMGDYADALIAFWDGKSGGTKHMIEYMMKLGKPIRVHFIKE